MIFTYTIVGHLGMKNVCKHFSELVNGKKISAVLVGAILVSGLFLGPNLFTDAEAGAPLSGGASFTPCLSEEVTHFDKIIFKPTKFLFAPGLPFISPFVLSDVKVVDDPGEVADLSLKVANFLNGLGYTRPDGTPVPAKFIIIEDVEYAIECIKLQSLQIWAVKYICGVLPITDMPFGLFRTEINIHNPNTVKTSVSFGTSNPPFTNTVSIPAGGDLDIPCDNDTVIVLNGKGFLEIQSTTELEIVAVYKNFELSEVSDMKGHEIFPFAPSIGKNVWVAPYSCGDEGPHAPPAFDAFFSTLQSGEKERLWLPPVLDSDVRIYNPSLLTISSIGVKAVDYTPIAAGGNDLGNVVFGPTTITLDEMEAINFDCKDLFPTTGIPPGGRSDGFIEISHANEFNLVVFFQERETSTIITASMDVEYIDPVIRIPLLPA